MCPKQKAARLVSLVLQQQSIFIINLTVSADYFLNHSINSLLYKMSEDGKKMPITVVLKPEMWDFFHINEHPLPSSPS